MTSLQASQQDDAAAEQKAVADYKALLGELEHTVKQVQQAKAEAEATLAEKKGALALQERILEEAVNELTAATNGKAAKEEQCENWRTVYKSETATRSNEINIVKQVENIIATKLNTMKEYLKERVN